MRNKKLWITVVVVLWLVALGPARDLCMQAAMTYGIAVDACPDGDVRQSAQLAVQGVRRGGPGLVRLRAIAHYTTGDADGELTAPVPRMSSVALALIDGKGAARPLEVGAWTRASGDSFATLRLPDVPDGDYKLRASFETRLGKAEVAAALPLYAPARIHVITDRPLYEPGNTVRFRAVVLAARDLAPLDHRPGTWLVRDPAGEVLLEEAAPAGEWGVVAGSFPLDKAAPSGEWKVAWRSADAIDEVAFTVAPFTLPRFRVDAIADRPFYRPGDRPVIKGAVIYASGAPVASAALDVAWRVSGEWPPPLEWQDHLLPKRAQTGANGRFELALPAIPADLTGTATLTALIAAVDPAGDRVTGAANVLLSKDGIQVSAVTELGDGLVESFNNRLYVRVATPDGRVVANTKVTVKRAWQPSDRGVDGTLDEDGVASLQIDPGAPVNIVIPAKPWRPAPRPPAVSRGDVGDLIGGQGASLADQVELDKWLPALAPCAKWLDGGDAGVRLGLRIDRGGAVVDATGGRSALERCSLDAVRSRRLPAGNERLYAVDLHFVDPELPRLRAAVESPVELPAGLREQFAELARGARDCLPANEGKLANMLGWRVRAGARDVELTGWLPDPTAGAGRAALACATSRLAGARIALADLAPADAIGLVRFAVDLPESAAQQRPQPTTMIGYELDVVADLEGKPSAKLRIAPGAVPPLRLRVAPVLAQAGEPVTAQLIRGPQFTGKLPDSLALDCTNQHTAQRLDPERRATLTLPAGVEGWCTVSGGGVRALVYVRPRAELAVTVVPKQDRYAPGDKAELAIQTTIGGRGGAAAVGLFGVDESLGQLVPLPGGDALGRLRPKVETGSPAFGVLDGQALALGRIRGANAAAATVTRVTSIPSPPQLDAVVSAQAASAFDPIEELTDRFYIVLAELHVQVRAWETKAPAAEKMTPATMARLWRAALDACAARGERVVDAYGRRLRLSRLPGDLLSLTDPRAVVAVATRLTEDVENWPAWVAREAP